MKSSSIRHLSVAIAVPMLALSLSACSDSGTQSGTTAAQKDSVVDAPSAKIDEITTATSPVRPVTPPDPSGSYDPEKVKAEGALPDMWLGDEKAPVTIVEYASTTCGHCASFHKETWPELKKQYVDTGKVRFTMREFPFDPRATAAFMLARCSGENYYPVLDVFFANQQQWAGAPGDTFLKTLFNTVKIAGFSQEAFDTCLRDQKLLDNVNAVRNRAADEFEVNATPTFLINGKKYSGALPIGQMGAIIDSIE